MHTEPEKKPSEPAAAAGVPETPEQLMQAASARIAELEAERDEMKDRRVRAEAETANVRARTRREVDETRQRPERHLRPDVRRVHGRRKAWRRAAARWGRSSPGDRDRPRPGTGIKANLRVPTRVACDACSGTGSADKTRSADTCATCHGAGKVRAQQGFFLVERTCPTCGGAGRVIRNPCKICQGQGTVQRERTLQVAIPAGVEDGTRIRLAGEGEAGGQGAPPGDLYVHVAIFARTRSSSATAPTWRCACRSG